MKDTIDLEPMRVVLFVTLSEINALFAVAMACISALVYRLAPVKHIASYLSLFVATEPLTVTLMLFY